MDNSSSDSCSVSSEEKENPSTKKSIISKVKFFNVFSESKETFSQGTPKQIVSSSEDSSIFSSESCPSNYAPDGGYGWIVVFASFTVNLIADGVTFSFGILFVEFLNEFGESKAVTAGIVSLFHAVPLLSGPIASALADRYGCRKVTVCGAFLACLGFLLSSITHSIYVLYLTFGLISGFGLSLCYVASIVIVAHYFEKRRSFATGIAVCGSGVGTFVFAPFTQYLIGVYEWRGTCVILAGCFLQIILCGLLYRDLESMSYSRKKKKKREASMSEIDQIRASLTNGDPLVVGPSFSIENNLKDPRMTLSLIDLPTFSIQSKLKVKKVNGLFRNNSKRKEGKGGAGILCGNDEVPMEYLHHLRIRRRSLTYRGAMLNINKYRLKASSCPDIYRNYHLRPVKKDEKKDEKEKKGEEEEEKNKKKKKKDRWLFKMVSYLKDYITCLSFYNVNYLLFCISNLILYAWYDVMYVYIVDYAEMELKYSSREAASLISVIGAVNTAGEFVIGWLGDQSWMKLNLLYAVCMVACGISTIIVPLFSRYYYLAFAGGLYGFGISANYSLTSTILVELVSLDQFSNAYGFILLIQGISNLMGPPFAGYLYDVTENWNYPFVLSGGFIALSGLILLILPILKRIDRSRDDISCV